MNLVKEIWTEVDGKDFQNYLISFGRPEKVDWTRRIVNTDMPLLAILSPNTKKIIKEISKGNFQSFLDLDLDYYLENTFINANLIMKIADFDTMSKYLRKLAEKSNNWATCDAIDFSVIKNSKKQQFFTLSKEFLTSDLPFVRRIGLDILFKLIDDEYLPQIFDILDSLKEEKEYYVNMAAAWLLCECYAKRKEETLQYLQRHDSNAFVIDKGVQKCRDSYRVSAEDKQMLLQFKSNKK